MEIKNYLIFVFLNNILYIFPIPSLYYFLFVRRNSIYKINLLILFLPKPYSVKNVVYNTKVELLSVFRTLKWLNHFFCGICPRGEMRKHYFLPLGHHLLKNTKSKFGKQGAIPPHPPTQRSLHSNNNNIHKITPLCKHPVTAAQTGRPQSGQLPGRQAGLSL